MSTALFCMDGNDNRIPYTRPSKTPFTAKCIQKLIGNSKSFSSNRKFRNHGYKAFPNQKAFCSLQITVKKTHSENLATFMKKQKRKLFSRLPEKMEFPDDLNQHFNNGSINMKEEGEQLFPTKEECLPDVLQNCGNENLIRFLDKYSSNREQKHEENRSNILAPQTPLRRVPSSSGGLGSDFSVLRSHIVPETPLRVVEDQEKDSRIFRVPETPKICMSAALAFPNSKC